MKKADTVMLINELNPLSAELNLSKFDVVTW